MQGYAEGKWIYHALAVIEKPWSVLLLVRVDSPSRHPVLTKTIHVQPRTFVIFGIFFWSNTRGAKYVIISGTFGRVVPLRKRGSIGNKRHNRLGRIEMPGVHLALVCFACHASRSISDRGTARKGMSITKQ